MKMKEKPISLVETRKISKYPVDVVKCTQNSSFQRIHVASGIAHPVSASFHNEHKREAAHTLP